MIVEAENLTKEVNTTPRSKCCGECAFRRHDPQGVQQSPEWQDEVEEMRTGWLTFYCVHTKDDKGRNQVCAGYQALYGRHV